MKALLSKKYTNVLSLILALSFIFSLNICSFADNAKMQWKYPQADDDMIYYWEFEKSVQEVEFNDIAMYIEFDVQNSGKQHLFNAKWLPEIPEEEMESAYAFNTSFYQHLHGISEYIAGSDIYGANVEELIENSGLSIKDAQEQWFKSISVHTDYTYPYKVEIFDNYDLNGRDIILGAYGAEAVSVEDTEINGYQALKAVVDYTHVYDDSNLSDEDWENIKKSIVRNYIFLFEPECEYLICVSGTMDMAVLTEIAENIDVHETQLERIAYNTGVNYLLVDLAKG